MLCAGSGISQEPRALAQAGFQVVALDFSARAIEIASGFEFPAKAFDFYCDPTMRRSGGKVDFVVGDILDSTVCAGPFDVIIERRTAQLFSNENIGALLDSLAGRLGHDGIFFSHSHDSAWRPPRKPRHFTESWFRNAGWTIWSGPGRKPQRRVAWLFTTTG